MNGVVDWAVTYQPSGIPAEQSLTGDPYFESARHPSMSQQQMPLSSEALTQLGYPQELVQQTSLDLNGSEGSGTSSSASTTLPTPVSSTSATLVPGNLVTTATLSGQEGHLHVTLDLSASRSAVGTTNAPQLPQTASATPSAAAAPSAQGDVERDRSSLHEQSSQRSELLQRLQALREENQRLKRRQRCQKCGLAPPGHVFLPCGHFIACKECSRTFVNCPLCGKVILADLKTFLA